MVINRCTPAQRIALLPKELNAVNEPDIKCWTAKRKAALVKELLRGQTTVAEAAKLRDL